MMDPNELSGEDYAYERQLVKDIVKPTGAIKAPQDQQVKEFLKVSANLEPRVVLSLLNMVLKQTEMGWVCRYRALCVVQHLLGFEEWRQFVIANHREMLANMPANQYVEEVMANIRD